MENYSNMTGWQELSFPCKSLKFSTAIAFPTFKIYGWKFTGYLILVCSFSFWWQDISKANCFHVFRKLITWLTNAKGRLRKNGHFFKHSFTDLFTVLVPHCLSKIQMCEIFITFETLSFSLTVPDFNFKVTSNVAYILKLGKKTQLLTGPWQAIPVFQQAPSLIFPLLPWVLCSLTTSFKKINNFTCMLKKQCI